MAKGDSSKAIEIWAARENGTASSVTAKHNLALVYHVCALDWENYSVKNTVEAERREKMTNYWKGAFSRWEHLATNEKFWEQVVARIRQLNEPNLPTGFARRMRATLPEALDKINAELAVAFAESGKIELARLHIQFMRETHQGLDNVEKTAELVLTPARNHLKEQIQRARESSQQNPSTAHEAARTLIEHARPLLDVFDLFFGEQEHFQKELFDEAATTVVNCLVSYQRKTGDNETFVKLLERTLPLAESVEVRRRIEENIGIGKGNLKGKEFDSVYSLLKSIQDSTDSPAVRLARFKRDAVAAIVKAAGISGFSENYGYLSATSADFKELFDSAAIVLRGISLDAWNKHQDRQTAVAANELAIKHATSSELKRRLAEDKKTLKQVRYEADLSPIDSAPELRTINGIGLTLYGRTDEDPATGSYLTTYYFVFLGIPIFPICRYRVTSDGNSYRFFGKAPLRTFDKCHLAGSIGLIALILILVNSGGNGSSSSKPSSYTSPSPAPSVPVYTPPTPSVTAYTPPASTTDAPIVEFDEPTSPSAEPFPPMNLQGLSFRGEKSFAVINGFTVGVGEHIGLAGALSQVRVVAVDRDRVTVELNGRTKVLVLGGGAPPYTPRPASADGNSGGNVYRVPTSVSSALRIEKAEIESERATLEVLEAQIERLGREIERDRTYLNRSSQYAVDTFNAKVDHYNALNQKAKIANAAFNERVDNYNAKLQRYGR